MKKTAAHCEFIGMLHVPVNTILTAPPACGKRFELPLATKEDWLLFELLEHEYGPLLNPAFSGIFGIENTDGLFDALEEKAATFSFFPFLRKRMLAEAEMYFRFSADTLMLENIAAPYFVRDRQPVAIVAVMSLLARDIRQAFPEKKFGIQILAFSDDLALIVALRHGFHFVRSETALFAGLRPEGTTPNRGNLATLYATRNHWQALHSEAENFPQIFVDLRKKHTIFPPGLAHLDFWKENLLFQKVEGAILTGPATGMPVDREELHGLRQSINSFMAESAPFPWKTKLLIGSGVSLDNLGLCRHYADGIIVGSSLKKNGYWENVLEEERLGKFMERWHAPKNE